MSDLTEGWGVIRPGDRKTHYYRNAWSLCGRVGFYFGPLEADEFPSPNDCTPCRKKLNKGKPVDLMAALQASLGMKP